MATLTNQQRANRWVKYMGVGFIFWAAVVLAGGLGWPVASGILAAGLFQILFTPERIDDERVRHLKWQAIRWGYALGFIVVALHNFVSQRPINLVRPATLTAFEGFIIATTVALGLFHYWRWQDGRAASAE